MYVHDYERQFHFHINKLTAQLTNGFQLRHVSQASNSNAAGLG